MNILVLGGSGFIGTNLVKELINQMHKITVFDAKTPDDKINGIEYIQGDFTKIEDYKSVFKDIDIVYHLISTTVPNNDRDRIEFDILTNLVPTIKVLNLCVENNVKKIIFASSGGSIYGDSIKCNKENDKTNPLYAYAINKLAIEKYLESFRIFYGLDYTVLRISNPYGKNHLNKKQGLINVILDKCQNDETIEIWGDGTIERDYIYIDDVIKALVLSIKNTKHKIFNISTGKAVSINKLLKIIQNITSKKLDVKYFPTRNFDIKKNVLNNSLAKKELGWKPLYTLTNGIKTLLERAKQ